MKGIHYRMHPKNVNVIQSADIDCCILADNHVPDWGFPDLIETMDTLHDVACVAGGIVRARKVLAW